MEVIRYYESVMAAKDVEIEGIPLPNMSSGHLNARDRFLKITSFGFGKIDEVIHYV